MKASLKLNTTFCIKFAMRIQEAMADLNFPEKILEELECLENMTSCHKVRMHSKCLH